MDRLRKSLLMFFFFSFTLWHQGQKEACGFKVPLVGSPYLISVSVPCKAELYR